MMTIENNIKDEKRQYDINREGAQKLLILKYKNNMKMKLSLMVFNSRYTLLKIKDGANVINLDE